MKNNRSNNPNPANNPHPHTPPHKTFGRHLKTMRQKMQESLGEVSGAVEIAVEQLDRFERGAELPNEDILMLLISHFGLADDEAVELWELAGYDANDRRLAGEYADNNDEQSYRAAPPVMMIALDNRVLYTNGADIVSDDSGVVLNFTQADGNGQRHAVSRVGMSYVQAEELLRTLQRALLHKKYLSGPKQLPPSLPSNVSDNLSDSGNSQSDKSDKSGKSGKSDQAN